MAPSPYDVWLLDLDGTLLEASPEHVRWVFEAVGDRLGHEFTDEQAELLWNGVGGDPDEMLLDLGVDPTAFWTAFHEVEDPQRRAEGTRLFDDASVVADLDGPTGLVTHCQSYLTEAVLEHHDIADWFDVVVCCDDDLGWKPDPAPVERALAALGARDDADGVLIGDQPGDVGAAWNAGLDAVHVDRFGHEHRQHCVIADYRVDRLTEFPPFATGPPAGD